MKLIKICEGKNIRWDYFKKFVADTDFEVSIKRWEKSSEIEDEDKKSNKIKTQFQKLSGLKKTGETLDLDSIKKDKKETTSDDSKKRKRKRISKGGVKEKK